MTGKRNEEINGGNENMSSGNKVRVQRFEYRPLV